MIKIKIKKVRTIIRSSDNGDDNELTISESRKRHRLSEAYVVEELLPTGKVLPCVTPRRIVAGFKCARYLSLRKSELSVSRRDPKPERVSWWQVCMRNGRPEWGVRPAGVRRRTQG